MCARDITERVLSGLVPLLWHMGEMGAGGTEGGGQEDEKALG